MEHLIKHYFCYSGDEKHHRNFFLYFILLIHPYHLNQTDLFPDLPVNIETNRDKASVGFFFHQLKISINEEKRFNINHGLFQR
jgi:hypothetical protein